MALITKDYLDLSALAYIDFSKSLIGATIKELVERKAVPEKDLNNPDLSVCQDYSSPRQILSDTNIKVITNLRFTFTNKTTSVLYHAYV